MHKKNGTKFVVVAGGVISGVGKGIITASVGKMLKEHDYTVTLIKIDPYINYDAGTLRPTEHGEVWVTEDGGEIDQDLGTYERFLNIDIPKRNNITTGQIYKTVIDRERRGEYLGQTVQFIPHIIDEILTRIKQASQGYDIAIVEIGGTVGDYENVPFLFAFKSLERELESASVAYLLVTYLPVPEHIGEMKTKPTQQAIRMLGKQGILPDFIVCRSHSLLDDVCKKKIVVCSSIKADHIIAAPDLDLVYQMPLVLEEQQLSQKLLRHFNLQPKEHLDWRLWKKQVHNIRRPAKRVNVAVIGKYVQSGAHSISDSYISIKHALMHAGADLNVGVDIDWIDAQRFEDDPAACKQLDQFDGVIIPGGFGNSGVEGKIHVISYVRTHNIPYLGICYGLQLAAIEFARNVCGLHRAHTTEIDKNTPDPIIDILPMQKELLDNQQYGGSMRLGAFKAYLKSDSKVYTLYKEKGRMQQDEQDKSAVFERHRHRYEVNPAYVPLLEQQGFIFSGYHVRADDTKLMEFAEIPSHPFFVATQAHPEFKSRLGDPSPLFYGFVAACSSQINKNQILENINTIKSASI